MNELIGKLKRQNYARQAGWLKKYRPDEYSILEVAGWRNRLRLDCNQNWVEDTGPIGYSDTLILKPHYEPEPEYDDRAVGIGESGLLEVAGVSIHCLLSWPDFVGFFYDDADGFPHGLALGIVAEWMRGGHKVYARFVKEAK